MVFLAHLLFWETKGNVKFEDFFSLDYRQRAFYAASLLFMLEEQDKTYKKAKRKAVR